MEILILLIIIGLPIYIIWMVYLFIRDTIEVFSAIKNKRKIKRDAIDNFKQFGMILITFAIIGIIMLIVSNISAETWFILFTILFVIGLIFLTIGPLFIGEIPFVGFGTEAKAGCWLFIIILIIVAVGFIWLINPTL